MVLNLGTLYRSKQEELSDLRIILAELINCFRNIVDYISNNDRAVVVSQSFLVGRLGLYSFNRPMFSELKFLMDLSLLVS